VGVGVGDHGNLLYVHSTPSCGFNNKSHFYQGFHGGRDDPCSSDCLTSSSSLDQSAPSFSEADLLCSSTRWRRSPRSSEVICMTCRTASVSFSGVTGLCRYRSAPAASPTI